MQRTRPTVGLQRANVAAEAAEFGAGERHGVVSRAWGGTAAFHPTTDGQERAPSVGVHGDGDEGAAADLRADVAEEADQGAGDQGGDAVGQTVGREGQVCGGERSVDEGFGGADEELRGLQAGGHWPEGGEFCAQEEVWVVL